MIKNGEDDSVVIFFGNGEVGGSEILGSFGGSSRGVVDGVFWGNLERTLGFVDT